MLILFDIDGTLLLSDGAGMKAMGDAGRTLYGEHFTMEGIEFSGRLDTLIWNDLVKLNSVANGQANHDLFRQTYGRMLGKRLDREPTARLLPGIAELVNQLNKMPQVTLGLLTGNYPETGRMKIQSAGLDPDVFKIAAWGCDGLTRRELTPVAMKRHAQASGTWLPPQRVVVIGDTPHDVDCAKVHGCRSIGVATGVFPVEALWKCGADLAVEDLADTHEILDWLMQTSHATPE